MTKSQLTIRLSSKKTNRHVSPISRPNKTYRFDNLEIPRVTFVRLGKYVEYLLERAVADAGTEGVWTSTHLVTLEFSVTDQRIEHVGLVQQTLNGSALALLCRYLARLESEVERRQQSRRAHWLAFNYKWCRIPYDEIVDGFIAARYE